MLLSVLLLAVAEHTVTVVEVLHGEDTTQRPFVVTCRCIIVSFLQVEG